MTLLNSGVSKPLFHKRCFIGMAL